MEKITHSFDKNMDRFELYASRNIFTAESRQPSIAPDVTDNIEDLRSRYEALVNERNRKVLCLVFAVTEIT
jgi:hypothetical protein